MRGATNGGREGGWPVLFQSTHPARGATGGRERQDRDQHISIHAPREGCDFLPLRVRSRRHISIHAPCEGCDTKREVNLDLRRVFQSTHPVRGATPKSRHIDAPRLFQSTHPVRGATARAFRDHVPRAISIHAPREGCDVRTRHHPSIPCYFNPRTP